MKITGLFKAAGKPRQVTDKFTVQKFYMDTEVDTDYPSIAEFQINNEKVDVSQLKPGDKITVHFNIYGKKWEKDGRSGFIQNLVAWKIEQDTPQVEAGPVDELERDAGQDDLPF